MTYPQVYANKVTVSVELSDKMWLAHDEYEHARAGCLYMQKAYGTHSGDPDFLTLLERLEKLSEETKALEWKLGRFDIEMDLEFNTPKMRKEIFDTVSAYIREAKAWLRNND